MTRGISADQVRGATVYAFVRAANIGPALQALEFEADIHLLHRAEVDRREGEVWTLPSDRWPARWEGSYVTAHLRRLPDRTHRCAEWRRIPEPLGCRVEKIQTPVD